MGSYWKRNQEPSEGSHWKRNQEPSELEEEPGRELLDEQLGANEEELFSEDLGADRDLLSGKCSCTDGLSVPSPSNISIGGTLSGVKLLEPGNIIVVCVNVIVIFIPLFKFCKLLRRKLILGR